jgi:hypothetical protein
MKYERGHHFTRLHTRLNSRVTPDKGGVEGPASRMKRALAVQGPGSMMKLHLFGRGVRGERQGCM